MSRDSIRRGGHRFPSGKGKSRLRMISTACAILSICVWDAHGRVKDQWAIVVPTRLQADEAVRVAVEDLMKSGAAHGISLSVVDDQEVPSGNAILVGDASRNALTAKLVTEGGAAIEPMPDEQGYQIRTVTVDGAKRVIVAGGSVIGDVYGLYWLWDRLRVAKTLPDINVTRRPALPARLSLAWGRGGADGGSKEAMRNALRYGMTWVSGPGVLDLVPWKSEPEKSRNEKNRDEARALARYAHALHMKFFAFANELTYHPSLLEAFEASLSVDDPRFWDALQAKYKWLLEALPELDGVEICTDDISGFWDGYHPFDLMHADDGSEWSYSRRYRTFVQKIHEVVVGRFDKTYFHFTWSVAGHEQHSTPELFRRIFTDDVPRKNLYLIPKVTAGDRWWHQPYNRTFNLTPHETLVAFEPMNYYESGQSSLFPTFAGAYYQAGLQTFLGEPDGNIRGIGYIAGRARRPWGTHAAYSYVLSRLAWEPGADIRRIAEDFCAIHFGKEPARGLAEVYLLTPIAYKYGLHIEPVSYGTFNSLVHMRVGTFPVQGYPSIDGGREHVEFLRKIYLRCKPWKTETLDDLDHGLATAKAIEQKVETLAGLIPDRDLARELAQSARMTRRLIETNNLYVRTVFAYFAYREARTADAKDELARLQEQLTRARERFVQTPGFGYHLFGVNQLQRNVDEALQDLDAAEQALRRAPTTREIEATIEKRGRDYERILIEQKEQAVRFAHVVVKVDGRDILAVQGDAYRIDHLRWDPPHVQAVTFTGKLPREAVTVIPGSLRGRPLHPFVLDQPRPENDYTARIYLFDKPPGPGVMEFELYYIPATPKSLGLPSWNTR